MQGGISACIYYIITFLSSIHIPVFYVKHNWPVFVNCNPEVKNIKLFIEMTKLGNILL